MNGQTDSQPGEPCSICRWTHPPNLTGSYKCDGCHGSFNAMDPCDEGTNQDVPCPDCHSLDTCRMGDAIVTPSAEFLAMRGSGKSEMNQTINRAKAIQDGVALAKRLMEVCLQGPVPTATVAKIAGALIELDETLDDTLERAARVESLEAQLADEKQRHKDSVSMLIASTEMEEQRAMKAEVALELCSVKVCPDCKGEGYHVVHRRRYECEDCSGTGRVDK